MQEGGPELRDAKQVLGALRIVAGNRREGQLVANEVDQLSPLHVLFVGAGGGTLLTAVSLPPLIETEAPHDHDEPDRELTSSARNPDAQSLEVVPAQGVEDEGIPVHDRVIVAAHPACDAQEQVAVVTEKLGPGQFTEVLVRSAQQVLERRGRP